MNPVSVLLDAATAPTRGEADHPARGTLEAVTAACDRLYRATPRFAIQKARRAFTRSAEFFAGPFEVRVTTRKTLIFIEARCEGRWQDRRVSINFRPFGRRWGGSVSGASGLELDEIETFLLKLAEALRGIEWSQEEATTLTA
ncbi:hypothetical protein [Microvirga ossetica]|nr:hypothetical protein [Microvirga ossetica]